MKSTQSIGQFISAPLLLTAVTFIIYNFVAGPVFFETNDDMAMMHIVNGFIFGAPDPHLVFQHHYLGLLYSKLYNLFPETPWYSLLLNLASFSAIYYIFKTLKEYIHPDIWLPLAIYLSIYAAHSIYIMQFSRVAILCGCAGILLFLDNIKTKSALTFIISALFILLSYMVRSSALLMVVVLTFPVIAFIAYQQKRIIKTIFLISLIIAATSIIKSHGENLIAKDKAWKEYYELNILRGYIHGNNLVKPATFKAAGFTTTEHQMFSSWNWFDKSIFNKKSLNKLVTLTKESASTHLDLERGLNILNQKTQKLWYVFILIFLLFFGGTAAFTFTAYATLILILLASTARLPLRILEPTITLIFVHILFLSNLNIKYQFNAYFSKIKLLLKNKTNNPNYYQIKTLFIIIVVTAGTYLHVLYTSTILRDKTTYFTNEKNYLKRLLFIEKTSIDAKKVYILPGLTRPTKIYNSVPKDIIGDKGIYAGWGVQMPAYYTNIENKTLSASMFVADNENKTPIIIYSVCDAPVKPGPIQILKLYIEQRIGEEINTIVNYNQELSYCAYLFQRTGTNTPLQKEKWQSID